MPVYPLRFTRWEAPRLSAWWAWWHLACTARRVRRGSGALRYLRFFWAFYFAYFVLLIYLAERAEEIARLFGVADFDTDSLPLWVVDPVTRIYTFLVHPVQVFYLLLVSLWAGAGLIAEDRRTGALALYLSKPVTRIQYLASRLAVMAYYIGTASILPALALLLFGILISAEPLAALADLRLVPGLLAYWVILTILFGVPILVLSSLTERGRTAGVLFVVLGAVLWAVGRQFRAPGSLIGTLLDPLRVVEATGSGLLRPLAVEGGGLEVLTEPWMVVSVVIVLGAAGLGLLWLRIRAGEGNR